MPRKPSPPPHVAAVYCRVSTKRQGEDGTSLETQEARCREHVASLGWPVSEAHVYRDLHTGAELWERPALTALREAMRRRECGAVVCYALDRLSRKQTHLGVLLDEAERAGVSLLFVTEALEETAVGRFLLSTRSFVAELEREKIAERTQRGRRQKLAQGILLRDGYPAFGYRWDPDGPGRVIYEPEAAIVREVYTLIAAGHSQRGVANTLNARGIPTPWAARGRKETAGWVGPTVARMVRNEAYRGETIRLKTAGELARRQRPPEEWIRLPEGLTPPIVTEDLWTEANRRLSSGALQQTRNRREPHLLRSLVRCAVCGLKCSLGRNDTLHHYYRCPSGATPRGWCGGSSAPAGPLEEWVWQYFREFVSSPETIIASAAGEEPEGDAEAVTRARKALAALDAREQRLLDAYEAGGAYTVAEFIERRAAIHAERASLAEILRGDVERTERARARQSETEAFLAFCEEEAAHLDSLTVAERWERLVRFNVQVTACGGTSRTPADWTLAIGECQTVASALSKA
jgi:site-specific DNA recombinase